jgi:hypothetical protein
MWVVDRTAVLVGDAINLAMADRDHRHNDGHLVAELRQSDPGHAR